MVDDVAVVLPVGTTGFLENPNMAPSVGYPMADCAGQPYLLTGSTLSVVRTANIMGNHAIFSLGAGTDPVSVKSVRAGATFDIDTCRCRVGFDCCNCTATFGPLQPARVLDLDTLGLVPPFRVESPQ
jgi:hypothetical protein